MAFTLYHFGPSGFLGLALRRWVDLPVLLLANVVVDVEVLIVRMFELGWPIHKYAHTFLIGAGAGALWGILAYPLRNFFKAVMQMVRLPYETGFVKMAVSGVLGVWLHVLIDSVYHFDVRPFWPWVKRNYMFGAIGQSSVLIICIILWVAAVGLYIRLLRSQTKKSKRG
ncbi:MAG: hypothetical protein ACYS21_13275 [Planctomycetota bacterium]|jgi:membrane-bound metal-dependent hydrolase YbcI (DUF457 family)